MFILELVHSCRIYQKYGFYSKLDHWRGQIKMLLSLGIPTEHESLRHSGPKSILLHLMGQGEVTAVMLAAVWGSKPARLLRVYHQMSALPPKYLVFKTQKSL